MMMMSVKKFVYIFITHIINVKSCLFYKIFHKKWIMSVWLFNKICMTYGIEFLKYLKSIFANFLKNLMHPSISAHG